MFQIGDKVVCVDDSFPEWASRFYSELPTKGRVYVVRQVCQSPLDGKPGVALIGIIGTWRTEWLCEQAFHAFRFRKLEELKNEARERQRIAQPIYSPATTRVRESSCPPDARQSYGDGASGGEILNHL